LKSAGLSYPSLHIEALDGGSISLACPPTSRTCWWRRRRKIRMGRWRGGKGDEREGRFIPGKIIHRQHN